MIKALLSGLFGNWEFVLAGVLAFGVWSGGVALKAHHAGYDSGVKSMQDQVRSANEARDAAALKVQQLTSQRDDALAALGKIEAQLRANKAEEDAQAARSAAALKQAQQQAADADAALKRWMDTYARAIHQPGCQRATGPLCPALEDY